MISDRLLYAHLAEGSPIIAFRVIPNPHKYTITARGITYEMSVERAQSLVDAKVIVGKPDDALWDRITFRAVRPEQVEGFAFSYFPRGWGYCSECGELLDGDKQGKGIASRHGFTFEIGPDGKKTATPPCDGSGKPLASPMLPKVIANAA